MSLSPRHELLVELFRNRPILAAELAQRVGGLPLPTDPEARLLPSEANQAQPVEFRADCVIDLDGQPPQQALRMVVEVQLRADARKRYSWPVYVAAARAAGRRPTTLLVVTTCRSTARWAGQVIPLGHPGFTLTPVVIGPDEVPVLTEPDAPELAVLSAVAHGQGPSGRAIAEAAVNAIRAQSRLDKDQTRLYLDGILSSLSPEDLAVLEDIMRRNRQPMSEWGRRIKAQEEAALAAARSRGLAEGREEGLEEGLHAEALNMTRELLTRRFGALPSQAQARLQAASRKTLHAWALRCLDAEDLDEVFAAH